jgi:hypothetical protein
MAWTAPKVFAVGEVLTAATLNAQVSNNFAAIAPVGSYMFMHRAATRVETTINGAWLECNGTAVSRTTYATLFGVTSTSYGAGNGSTTFNVPDLAGRVPVGIGGNLGPGANDGVAFGNRRPHHRHTPHSHVYGPAGPATGNQLPMALGTLSGGADPSFNTSTVDGGSNNGNDSLDAPAYQVCGVWSIKYTA